MFCANEKLTDASLSTVYENGDRSVPFTNAVNTVPKKEMISLYFPLFLVGLLPLSMARESEAHGGMVQCEGG